MKCYSEGIEKGVQFSLILIMHAEIVSSNPIIFANETEGQTNAFPQVDDIITW